MGRRMARMGSPRSVRQLMMLAPRPWERGFALISQAPGSPSVITWDPAYDSTILAQADPMIGFSRTDAKAIRAAVGRSRTRSALVRITHLANGKWRGTVVDEQGKPVEFQDFSTEAAAQRWKREEMRETHLLGRRSLPVRSGAARLRRAPIHHHAHGER